MNDVPVLCAGEVGQPSVVSIKKEDFDERTAFSSLPTCPRTHPRLLFGLVVFSLVAAAACRVCGTQVCCVAGPKPRVPDLL